jgi:5'-methylthioadenosine phosphorylase
MTALPEAKLAREAEMCYATMAWVTDYDCWRQGGEPVTVEMVVQNLSKNVAASRELLRVVVPRMADPSDCPCGSALEDAIITPREGVPEDVKRKLAPLVGRYLA